MGQTPAFYFVGAFYFLRCLTHQVNFYFFEVPNPSS